MHISIQDTASMTGTQIITERDIIHNFLNSPVEADDDNTAILLAGDRLKKLNEVIHLAEENPNKLIGDVLEIDRKETQLRKLLEGLIVPNIDIWMEQDPDTLLMLGAMIAMKSSGAPKDMIEMAQRKLMNIIVDPDAKDDEPKIYLVK